MSTPPLHPAAVHAGLCAHFAPQLIREIDVQSARAARPFADFAGTLIRRDDPFAETFGDDRQRLQELTVGVAPRDKLAESVSDFADSGYVDYDQIALKLLDPPPAGTVYVAVFALGHASLHALAY
jgi:hypothetical protein